MSEPTSSTSAAAGVMHNLARSGFDSSGGSGLYDRARPSYPLEAIHAILSSPASLPSSDKAGLNIVEIGSGTGICTRLLLSESKSAAAGIKNLVAVEPSQGMRHSFEQNVIKSYLPDPQARGLVSEETKVTCVDGTFDTFELPQDVKGKVDLVVIAQAWHWAPDFDAALKAIASALRPGGVFALIWNLEDRDAAHWVGALRDLYEKYEDNTPQYRHNYWHSMYSTPSMNLFDALPAQHFRRDITTTMQGVVDRVLSKSYITVLPQERQKELEVQIRELLGSERDDEKLQRTWIDKGEGSWKYPYRTDLFLFRKK